MALLASSTLIVIAITLIVVVPSSLADANFISEVCKGVRDIPDCTDVLKSDPRSVNATTRVELQSISLDICTAAAREGEKTSEEEKAKNERDAKMGIALGLCISEYSDAVFTLEQARTDFGNHAYEEAAHKIGDANFAADNCEKAFYNQGVNNVMKQMNKKMDDRCDISWQLIF